MVVEMNAKQINIHKQNPEIQFFQPETKKNSRLRSPVVDRHPILINGDEISQDRYIKYFTSAQLTATFGIALRKLNFANMKMKVEL